MTSIVISFAVLLVLAAIAGGVFYLILEKRREVERGVSSFRAVVVQQLQKRGPAGLDFSSLVETHEVASDTAANVARALFSSSCQSALEDAQITSEERRYLLALRDALGISAAEAERLESAAAENRYLTSAHAVLADGVITPAEAEVLERLRNRFRLSMKRAAEIVGDPARKGYTDLFREVIRDGRITPEELEQLRWFRSAFGISKNDANDIVQHQALGLYRQWLFNILQDGDVTSDEEQGLAWLRKEFNLNPAATERYDEQLREAKELAAYRKGDLPTIRSTKIFQGGEICHWESRCSFEWKTTTKSKDVSGELILTSHQLIFSSPLKSFSVSPSKIIDVVQYSNALVLKTSTNKGSGTYYVRDPKVLEAVLVGLVRRHKFQLCANYSSDRTRHIPDSVRREVWHRDGGQCVRCQAADYLEYDHIIPHSRGGANTVANVQILCRKCNNLKKDRI